MKHKQKAERDRIRWRVPLWLHERRLRSPPRVDQKMKISREGPERVDEPRSPILMPRVSKRPSFPIRPSYLLTRVARVARVIYSQELFWESRLVPSVVSRPANFNMKPCSNRKLQLYGNSRFSFNFPNLHPTQKSLHIQTANCKMPRRLEPTTSAYSTMQLSNQQEIEKTLKNKNQRAELLN